MSGAASVLAMIAVAKARIALEKITRWPAGAPGGKGGEFAPKGTDGGAAVATQGGHGVHPWGMGPKAPPPASALPHPKVDDKGAEVLVHYPTKPGDPAAWGDKSRVATAVPGGTPPAALNGVPFKTWKPPTDWRKVDGTNEALDAGDPLDVPPNKRAGAGVVILEPDGRMWLTKPTNGFGGYEHSWPKGGVEEGLTLQQTAVKEAWEETGLKVKITGVLGDYEGDTSVARYYIARRVGGSPADMGWETQAMRLTPAPRLKALLNRSRDKVIADDITDLLRSEGIIKSAPATLYVRRDLLNTDELIAWAKAQGFATTTPAAQLHVTIAYSKTPVDWSVMGEQDYDLTVPVVDADVDRTRIVQPLGDGGAIVLKFQSDELESRWREMHDLGASWDFDRYQPHVTITWNGGGVDLAKVVPFAGPLEFGPEVFEPIDTNWRDKLVEKAGKAPEPPAGAWQKQPRWPAGTSLGGQWKQYDGQGFPLPPKIAGGLEGANSNYQKQANALYTAFKAGDETTVKAAVAALGEKVAANAAKGAKSSHVKWTAQVHQFATSLLETGPTKVKAVASADAIRGPLDLATMKQVGAKPGGSAPGAVFSDAAGTKWLVKGNAAAAKTGAAVSDMRAANEVLASKLMQAVGAGAPDMKLVNLGSQFGGGLGVASKWLDGMTKFDPGNKAHLAAAREHFATHAWLGNWDAIGADFDNVVLDKNGKALCIDPGGSILFRAMGEMKQTAHFGPTVTELATMRDPAKNPQAAAVYGGMTAHEIAKSAEALKSIDDATILKLVDSYGPGNAKMKQALAAMLIARRDFVLKFAASVNEPPKPAPPPPPPKPTRAAAAPAAPGNAAAGLPNAPTFTTGFPKTDNAYSSAVGMAQKLHEQAAGGGAQSLAGLATMKDLLKSGVLVIDGGSQKVQAKSKSAKKLGAYLDALHADASGKFQAATEALIAAKIEAEAKSKAAANAKVKQAAVALPDFEDAKLPASNTNAASHNGKVEAIKALAQKADVQGLLALNYGTNTYGKKQAQLANDTLAALGSSEKVVPGQKTGAHPALGNAPPAQVPGVGEDQAGAVSAPKKAPAVEAALNAKAGAGVKAPKPKPVFKPEQLLAPPDFKNWPGKGGPLSSAEAVNDANNKAVQSIYAAAKTGDLLALKSLTFDVVDKATGQPTGAKQSLEHHPSQHVKAYWKNLITEVDLQLNPPVMPDLGATVREVPIEVAARKILAVPTGKSVASVASSQKVGDYIILGKIGQTGLPQPTGDNTAVQAKSWQEKVAETWTKSSSSAKATWHKYLSSAGAKELNTALRSGNVSPKQLEEVKAFNELLVDIPEGTSFVRSLGSSSFGSTPNDKKLKQLEAFIINATPGTVVQEPGFTSSSWSGAAKVLGGNKFKWKFTAAKGVKAFPAWLSQNVGEGEALFPPNQRYMIRGVKKVGSQYEIDAVLLPTIPN